jgi:hypothetical protein
MGGGLAQRNKAPLFSLLAVKKIKNSKRRKNLKEIKKRIKNADCR